MKLMEFKELDCKLFHNDEAAKGDIAMHNPIKLKQGYYASNALYQPQSGRRLQFNIFEVLFQ